MSGVDGDFKARMVQLILSHDAEGALKELADRYDVDVPSLQVGLPRGHANVAGCYVLDKVTIYVASGEGLSNPFLILHEFYHHLRSVSGRHKGTERYANEFARDYLEEYKKRAV